MDKGPLKALLAVLAVAGYQNRDKIAEMLRGATQRGQANTADPHSAGPYAGGPPSGGPDAAGADPFGQPPAGQPWPGARETASPSAGGGLGDILGGLKNGGLGSVLAGGSLGSILNSGLGELLDQFRQTGHGDKADSWVKTGANQPIDDRELSDALGPEVLADLAARTGLSKEEILRRLSKDLPDAVDTMTPEGRVPPVQPI